MKTNVCIEDNHLKLNIYDLIDMLSPDDKRELAHKLLFDQDMMNKFIEDMMTDLATPSFNYNYWDARKRFTELLPAMSKELIATLIHELDGKEKEKQRMEDWAWRLWKFHCHERHEDWSKVPSLGQYVPLGWEKDDALRVRIEKDYGFHFVEGQGWVKQ